MHNNFLKKFSGVLNSYDKINNSPCAKFESAEDKGRNIIITSEIKTLSEAFMSLDLVESNEKLNLEQIGRAHV